MPANRAAHLTVTSDASIQQTLERINSGGEGICFVTHKNGQLCGVVTDGDIRRALLRGVQLFAPIASATPPTFVFANEDVAEKDLLRLISHRVTHVPIVAKDGTLVNYATKHGLHRISVLEPHFTGKELEYASDCIESGWVSSQGRFVTLFEETFSSLHNGRHAVSTCNGTTALHLTLAALGIQGGDEVIVPNLTFAASANAVVHAGATPVLTDVAQNTWTLCPKSTAEAITSRTKAIMAVHLYGNPCDMQELRKLADDHNIVLIEDAAEALGATCEGVPAGVAGEASAFSFFGNKMITTGEGGMALFRNSDDAERARKLRDHGMLPSRRYWHDVIGYNYRLTNLQAAIGLAQLEKLEYLKQRKHTIASAYTAAFRDVPGITLQQDQPRSVNANWLFTILLDAPETKEHVTRLLKDNQIDSRPMFHCLSEMPPYKHFPRSPSLATSLDISPRGLSLPSSTTLTNNQQATVIAEVLSALETVAQPPTTILH